MDMLQLRKQEIVMRLGSLGGLATANRGLIRKRLFLFGVCLVTINILWRLARYALHFPLWPDEGMVAMNFVDHGFWDIANPARHYYVQIAPLFFWWAELAVTKIMGLSDWSLRFLPFAAGICGMLLFYRLSTKLLPAREALLAVAIFASSYCPVRSTTEVKPYSLDLLASVIIMSLGLWLWRQRTSIRAWLAFAFACSLALWCSFTSVFVAGGVMLALLPPILRAGEWRWIKFWIATGVVITASFVLSLLVFTLPMKNAMGFLYGMWASDFPPLDRPWVIPWWLLTTHSGILLAYPFGGENFRSSFTLILVITGVLVLWRRDRWKLWFLLAPAALSLLAAFLMLYPYGGSDRINQHLAPAICLLAGVGLMGLLKASFTAKRIPSVMVFVVATFGAIAVSSAVYDVVKPYYTKYDALRRDALVEVARLSKPGDIWVVANSVYPSCKSSTGYKIFSHSSLEFYFHALAPCKVVWDHPSEASAQPSPGATVWLLHHSCPPVYGVKPEELDTLLKSFVRRFGAPRVRKWEIDSNERIEAFAFTADPSMRTTRSGDREGSQTYP
jgi:4-amino-4-deoxy-L-arabinose transferase-like glycosyltransferase